MKRALRGELVQLLPVAAMFAAAALCWSHVPDRIALHWNLHGEADRFGGKFSGLLLLPLISLAVYLLTFLLPLCDPGRANYRAFAGTYNVIRLSIMLFLSSVHAVVVLIALGYRINIMTVVGVGLGVLFILLGNAMGKIRPNWFVGIRTPWTLSSKKSWTKTHRLAGWLFVVMGLFAAAWGIVPTVWMLGMMLTVDGVSFLAIVVYSYLVYRKDPFSTTPAGTSPGMD